MWVPIPFEKSFRMAYTRTRYGTGYYIFHHYLPGVNLSQPLRAWDGKTPPDPSRTRSTSPRRDGHSPSTRQRSVVQLDGHINLPKNGLDNGGDPHQRRRLHDPGTRILRTHQPGGGFLPRVPAGDLG
jgi:hypothetical protein